MRCKPFDKLFRVLLSPDYLPAMRRRRTSESLGKKTKQLLNLNFCNDRSDFYVPLYPHKRYCFCNCSKLYTVYIVVYAVCTQLKKMLSHAKCK